jgi:hypothetical protein
MKRTKEDYEVVERIEQIHASQKYEEILDLMLELGYPKSIIIQYKLMFGIPVSPDEIDDKRCWI